MKRIFLFLGVALMAIIQSCSGPEGPQGPRGSNGQDGVIAEVFELKNVNFGYNAIDGYTIYQTLNPNIYSSDTILIYRMTGTINSTTPIWQLIPRTLFLSQGELDYDFDFSKQDFTIYAGGTYNLALTPAYINNQTFRIVIVPGAFSGKSTKSVNFSNYNAVIKYYNIDESHIKVLNR